MMQYEMIVNSTNEAECHQWVCDSDLNIISISMAGENQTYKAVKKTISPLKRPCFLVKHACCKEHQLQIVKMTRISHMCPLLF